MAALPLRSSATAAEAPPDVGEVSDAWAGAACFARGEAVFGAAAARVPFAVPPARYAATALIAVYPLELQQSP